MDNFVVLKFGGSSLCLNGYNIISEQILNNKIYKIIFIVSAIQKTTDYLYNIINNKNKLEYFKLIKKKHEEINDELLLNKSLFNTKIKELEDLIRLDNFTINNKIKILGFGEILSSIILQEIFIKNNYKSKLLNSYNFIKSKSNDDKINKNTFELIGEFYCDSEELTKELDSNINIYVSQGFIASTKNNKPCLLTRSGSDTSASLIAASINAKKLEIWTDVDGIFTADPKYINNPILLNRISYKICQELAASGANVVHPYCVKPCEEKNIPIYIRNTFGENKNIYTTICDKIKTEENYIYGITIQNNITLFTIESLNMWENYGFVSSIFEVFSKYNLDVNIITTSQFSIKTTVRDKDEIKINKAVEELKEKYKININNNCSIISIISDNIFNNRKLHNAINIVNFIGNSNLYLTHYSSNNLNLSFVINSSISKQLLNNFHYNFIQDS